MRDFLEWVKSDTAVQLASIGTAVLSILAALITHRRVRQLTERNKEVAKIFIQNTEPWMKEARYKGLKPYLREISW